MTEHVPQFQTDQKKNESVEKKLDHFPDRASLQPRSKAREFGDSPTMIQACRYHRQHAGNLQFLRQQIRGKRGEQRDRDLDRRIFNRFEDSERQPADDQSDGDATEHDPQKLSSGMMEGERARGQRGNRKTKRNQSGGIIDQAFAFDHGHNPAGNPQVLRNGGGGDSVRRGNDCAQNETRRQRKVRQQIMREITDRYRRTQHQANRQQQNRPQVEVEIAPGRENRRGIKERRQKKEKHQLWIQSDCWQTGNERDRQAANHQQDGVRNRE